MSILMDKPHDFICLVTADTKHSQCLQKRVQLCAQL